MSGTGYAAEKPESRTIVVDGKEQVVFNRAAVEVLISQAVNDRIALGWDVDQVAEFVAGARSKIFGQVR